MKRLVVTSAGFLTLSAAIGYAQTQASTPPFALPPQSVFVDLRSFAVLPENGTFRTDSFNQRFNPTSTPGPFFQVFDRDFLSILGPNPSIRLVARNDTFAFAHEAPIYVRGTDEVFFASSHNQPLGMSDLNHNNRVSKISMTQVERALMQSQGDANVPITPVPLPDSIQMTNGGTGPLGSNLLLVNSGRGPLPPNLALVNPRPPHNVTVLLNNYFGRQFNSPNDVKIHPSGNIFFTDDSYGFRNDFRDAPLMPNQVYRLDPDTGAVRVVATGFDRSNGLAFTKDGRTAYVGDAGASGGLRGNNQTEPATLYIFDVDPNTQTFLNRRVFAYIDAGIPDGIQIDMQGNVFTSTADGVQVFAPDGRLLGKIFLNTLSANMVFAPPDRLVILAETRIYVAKIAAKGVV